MPKEISREIDSVGIVTIVYDDGTIEEIYPTGHGEHITADEEIYLNSVHVFEE